jgi:hypothetical protein
MKSPFQFHFSKLPNFKLKNRHLETFSEMKRFKPLHLQEIVEVPKLKNNLILK